MKCNVLCGRQSAVPGQIEFDCRPGAIAQSLALREPKYQEIPKRFL